MKVEGFRLKVACAVIAGCVYVYPTHYLCLSYTLFVIGCSVGFRYRKPTPARKVHSTNLTQDFLRYYFL